MLRALSFDVGSTLADAKETHRKAFNMAFRKMDLDWQWWRKNPL